MLLQTYTGRAINPLAPRTSDIAIEDIAHALALQCRFGGHIREFYSVAQHAWLVSQAVPPADALWALLHDASEAYLMDLPTPVKRVGPLAGYSALEAQLQRVIYQRFGLAGEEPASVRVADQALLRLESTVLHPTPDAFDVQCQGVVVPDLRVLPVEWRVAERAFLTRFAALTAAAA